MITAANLKARITCSFIRYPLIFDSLSGLPITAADVGANSFLVAAAVVAAVVAAGRPQPRGLPEG
jgi:hypothetical protein